MSLYEQRIYDVGVGNMPEAQRLYREQGYPVIEALGADTRLVGFFISDTGPLHQIMHLWRFADDAARRAHWAELYGSSEFMAFAGKIRPLLDRQQVQLWTAAPWGPKP